MSDHLVLASSSPRRRALMTAAGHEFVVDVADVDESARPDEPAATYVERLARAKASAVAPRHPGAAVIGADTIVTADGELLGKPVDEDDAAAMLTRLAGRAHEVLTGVAIVEGGNVRSRVVSTTVQFRELTADEIADYVATGEPLDKAGAYAIQGGAAAFVAGLDGPFDNVVGLPMEAVDELLGGRPTSESSPSAGRSAG